MRGAGYAAWEIVIFLLIAALIGWILRAFYHKRATQGASVDLEQSLHDEKQRSVRLEADLRAQAAEAATQRAEFASAGTATAKLEAALKAKDADVARLSGEAEAAGDAKAGLAERDARIVELEAASKAKDADVARLSGEAKGAGDAKAGLAERDARIVELEAASKAKDAEVARLNRETQGLSAKSTIAERDARIQELERRVVAQPSAATSGEQASRAPSSPSPSGANVTGNEPTKDEAVAKVAEIARRTAGVGLAVDDDLKKVHGIGPVIEKTLKGLGITSYRQVARFEPDDIAYVTAALEGFPGRIERDDWMGSAAALHKEKYSSDA